MERNVIYVGHVLDILNKIPDQSIDCCITSPPYWNKRDYHTKDQIWGNDLPCDHVWVAQLQKGMSGGSGGKMAVKGQENFGRFKERESYLCSKCGAWKGELGRQPDPMLYVKHLVMVFKAIRRVLKTTGSLWVNIGDTYTRKKQDGPNNSVVGIPYLFAIEMIKEGFALTNPIIWNKKNAMPEEVTRRFSNNYEHFFFFTIHKSYYFKQLIEKYLPYGGTETITTDPDKIETVKGYFHNKKSVWETNLQPSSSEHLASFPTALIAPALEATCPPYICSNCGFIRTMKTERSEVTKRHRYNSKFAKEGLIDLKTSSLRVSNDEEVIQRPRVIQWTKCDCVNRTWERGIVLDPFMGTGTTALVALQQNKDFIGIDLNPKYKEIAMDRIQAYTKTKKLDHFLKLFSSS